MIYEIIKQIKEIERAHITGLDEVINHYDDKVKYLVNRYNGIKIGYIEAIEDVIEIIEKYKDKNHDHFDEITTR